MQADPNDKLLDHTITTPEGQLTYKTGGNRKTTWITEYLIKKHEDVELIEKYMPVAKLNNKAIAAEYDRIGDAGILRGFVWGDQAGCWQHACCLMADEQLILECIDHPDWVHRLLHPAGEASCASSTSPSTAPSSTSSRPAAARAATR